MKRDVLLAMVAALVASLASCTTSDSRGASEAVKKWFMEMGCCTRRYWVLSAQAG
jgi:hypothetical protein